MSKSELIARQSAHPRGVLGHVVGRVMAPETAAADRWVFDALAPKAGERILEIGCGHGRALRRIADQTEAGEIFGVDPSDVMRAVANRYKRRGIRSDRARIEQGDVRHMLAIDESFDKAFSIHTLYFWPDMNAGLREIRRVLRPHGDLLLAYHGVDWLWWIHAIHHDTPQMHVMKAGRLHLLEGTIRFILVSSPLILLGAPAAVFVWLGLLMNFEGNLNHSNLAQRFPSWVHYLIPTVQVHHVHHARDRKLQGRNLAGGSPLWDLAFGTFAHPDRNPVEAFGIEGDPVPKQFGGQLLYPVRMWLGRPCIQAVEELNEV